MSDMTKEEMTRVIADVLESYNSLNPEGFDDHTVALDSMEDFIDLVSFGDFGIEEDYPFIEGNYDEDICSMVFKWKESAYSLNFHAQVDNCGVPTHNFTSASMCKVKLVEKTYKVYVRQEAGE